MPKNQKVNKPQSILRSGINFPTFGDLPGQDELDLNYYDETSSGGFSPSQHWCFLGEIVDFIDDKGQALAPQVKKGHTVAVLYGEQHGFLDMSVGIRVEEASNIKIIPCSLDQLLQASDKMAARKDQPRRCGSCGQEENSSENRQLRLCSRCKQASYCGESCQKKAWADGHKADCKALVGIQWFTTKDWKRFHDWFGF